MSDATELSRKQFGASAADYLTSEIHAKGESLDWMLKMAQPQSHWKAIDIGTGAGHTAVKFSPHVQSVAVTDPTPQMLGVAKSNVEKHNLKNLEFVQAAADKLPFPNDAFDLATCRLAAHHFADLQVAFREIHRVLKPGGVFVIADNFTLPDAEQAKYHNDFESLRDPSHQRLLSLVDQEEQLQQAGFAVVEFVELSKAENLEPWANRQRCSPEVKTQLRDMLAKMPKQLQMLLDPKPLAEDDWTFTLWESVFLTRRL